MEDAIKMLQVFYLTKIFICSFCCYLLNVASYVKKTSKAFEITLSSLLASICDIFPRRL